MPRPTAYHVTSIWRMPFVLRTRLFTILLSPKTTESNFLDVCTVICDQSMLTVNEDAVTLTDTGIDYSGCQTGCYHVSC